MNNFFTKKWYDFLYSEMTDCLPQILNIFTIPAANIAIVVENDGKYDLEELIKEKFEKYLEKKKKYIESYSNLEKRFGKFEKIDELGSYEYELDKFKIKIDSFVKENKNKIQTIINKLKENGIDINETFEDKHFKFLSLGILSSELKKQYENVINVYMENLYYFDNLSSYELFNINFIRNDVNSFLTCYTDYLNLKEDKFDKSIENIDFEFAGISKYVKNGNDAILEISSGNTLYKFRMYNVRVNDNLSTEIAYDLSKASSYIEEGLISTYEAFYGNYEDYKYYLELWLYCIPKSGQELVVSFIADKITIETSVLYPLLDKYNRLFDDYKENVFKYEGLLGEKELKFFVAPYIINYIAENIEYVDNDLIFNYKEILKKDLKFTIKFINVSIISEKEEFNNLLKNNTIGKYPGIIRFINYNDNKFEIGFLISNEKECIISCDDIVLENDTCLFLKLDYKDLYNPLKAGCM